MKSVFIKIFVLFTSIFSFVGCGMSSSLSSVTSSMSVLNKYTVTWKNYDGSVLEVDNDVIEGSTPSYDGATPIRKDCGIYRFIFDGWDTTLSPVTEDTTYVATFKLNNDYNPIANKDSLYYGYYPQKVVSDTTLHCSLLSFYNKESDDYFEYENVWYYAFNGIEYYSNDGVKIENGIHFYVVDQIEWIIRDSKDNNLLVSSSRILDSKRFNEKLKEESMGNFSSNYFNSELRKWMNSSFLTRSFGKASHLISTFVDNSLTSTKKDSSNYLCEDSNDFVFLPSIADLCNPNYGFVEYGNGYSSDVNRTAMKTDFARANNLLKEIYLQDQVGDSWYWTRTSYPTIILDQTAVFCCMPTYGRIDVPSAVDLDEINPDFYFNGGFLPWCTISM